MGAWGLSVAATCGFWTSIPFRGRPIIGSAIRPPTGQPNIANLNQQWDNHRSNQSFPRRLSNPKYLDIMIIHIQRVLLTHPSPTLSRIIPATQSASPSYNESRLEALSGYEESQKAERFSAGSQTTGDPHALSPSSRSLSRPSRPGTVFREHEKKSK